MIASGHDMHHLQIWIRGDLGQPSDLLLIVQRMMQGRDNAVYQRTDQKLLTCVLHGHQLLWEAWWQNDSDDGDIFRGHQFDFVWRVRNCFWYGQKANFQGLC